MDLDRWLETIRGGAKYLLEHDLKTLCRYVSTILCEESNVQVVHPPVIICGDIHGQFRDLLQLFQTGGEVDDGAKYIFMGDFVDRGMNSLETLTLLLLLKARYPTRMTLLRGNHESRQVTAIYGFWDECQKKYGGSEAWRCCTDVFDHLPIAAVVGGRVFCVHGGLSPQVQSVDQIRLIRRFQEIPNDGMFCDLMWSDPEESIKTWGVSPRGAGWHFGAAVTDMFMTTNKLDLIARAHQLVQEGYKYHFKEEKLVTVWSAPNYCYRCGNIASILMIDDKLEQSFRTFQETSPQYIHCGAQQLSYFL